MNKPEFFAALRQGLSGLPQEDIDNSIEYYGEMIDDRMEDGLTEEEAVLAIGSVEEIVSQILSETPLSKLVKAKVRPNRALKVWEIVLLILGSPVWLPLLLAAASVLLAVYVVFWAVILSLYAVDLSFAAGGVAGVLGSLLYLPSGNAAGGVLFVGMGFVCAGIAILLFFCFQQITKALLLVSKKTLLGMKSCFLRKGAAQ